MKLSNKYHKIPSVFKRNMGGDKKLIIGDWALPELKYLKDNDWIFTEKVDGTNIRIMWNGEEVTFGGRSDDAQIYTPLLLKLQEKFMRMEPRQKFAEIFGTEEVDVVLYGEGYGNRIQSIGKDYIADGVDFVLFDVSINRLWLERVNVEDIAGKLDTKVVPIIGHGTLKEMVDLVKKGFKSKWGEFTAEGIVARPRVDLLTRRRERIITKIKYKDFL